LNSVVCSKEVKPLLGSGEPDRS